MKTRRTLLAVLLAVVASASTGASQTATLRVGGDVPTALTLSAADLKAMPRTSVEIKEEARTVVYEGVLVAEILNKAGAPLGSALRGDALTSYVVMSASDGYSVVFSLAELDPAMIANDIIVADLVDGKPLFTSQGPFRIVAPKDSRPARSVRMLEKIDLVRVTK